MVMKTNIKNNLTFIGLFSVLLMITSCSKEELLEEPAFDVKINASTFKVGDRVNFNFTGNPDIISFYSGEVGNSFDYINGRQMPAIAKFSFYTSKLSNGQPDQLEVLVSSDFNGVYTLENVQAATWIPITSSFNYATGTPEVYSTEIDISNIAPKKDNLYVGFRYKTKPRAQASNLLGTRWRITNLSFLLISDASTDQKALAPNSFMNVVVSSNYETNRVRLSSIYVEFNGNATNTAEATEGWLITDPVMYNGFVDFGPDKSKQVKTVGTPSISSFNHVYNQPGTYKAVFTAANANVDGSKQVKKEITLTINP